MSRYPAYPEYKASGVEWFKLIPAHWADAPLKRLTSKRVSDGPHETPIFTDDGIPFLSVDGIQENQLVFEGCRYISQEDHQRYSRKCRPQNGDVLLGKAASVGKTAYVDVKWDFNVWSPLAVIRPDNKKAVGKFLYYSLQSRPLQTQCELFSNSNTQKNLGMGDIENLCFPNPPLDEQRTIARFLDAKTAQIDALIAKKVALLAALAEQRTAMISHAVTRGLDPTAPMKDSGVAWLGEIPAHWVCGTKLGYLSDDKKHSFVNGPFGSDLLTSELVDEGVPVIYSGDVKPGQFSRKSNKYVTDEKAKQLNFCRVDPTDLLLAKVGDPPGDATVYPEGEPSGIVTQDVVRIKVNQEIVCPEYLCFLMNSQAGRYLIRLISVEATRGRFSLADFKSLRVFIPPLNEQNEIVQGLANKLRPIDQQRVKIQQAIDALREYRTALITNAVTGKIDVRGVAAR